MRTGLVLGAGGLVGQAYEAGVLAALHESGWDPRSADVVVGTSAGSVVGSLLRLGLSASDMAAWASDQDASPEGVALLDALGGDLPELPPPSAADLLTGWRLPTPALLARIARRPWAFRPGLAALTLLPAGQVEIRDHARVLDDNAEGWPDGLRICVARRNDGRRVVLGRPGAPKASLSDAVAASCAIPGYLAPVRIGRTEYIDGGVHSTTNADVLARSAFDVVVIVAPMSVHGLASRADAPVRLSARRRLDREVRRLKASGAQVIRIEPSRRVLSAMGYNAMADDRAERVVTAGYRQATAVLRRPGLAERLALLAEAGTARAPAA